MKNLAAQTQVKTIDVQAKEWFDKVNGNSYFAALVTVNFGMPDEKRITLPFQYGYGDHYKDMAFKALINEGIIEADDKTERMWNYADRNNVIVRTSKQENCKKRDLKNI